MNQGKVFLNLLREMQKAAETVPELEDLSGKLSTAVNLLGETALQIGTKVMSPRLKEAFSFARPFLDAVGDVCLAWMHVWRATIAVAEIKKTAGSLRPEGRVQAAAVDREAAFYEGVLQTAKFFVKVVLPTTIGTMNAIQSFDTSVTDIPESSFGAG
jgi:hypothetical protein